MPLTIAWRGVIDSAQQNEIISYVSTYRGRGYGNKLYNFVDCLGETARGESNVVLAPLADQHRVPAVIANIDEQVALPLTYVFAITAYARRQATMLPGA